MKKIIKKYTKPGKWEIKILFDNEGEEKEWVGIVDARDPGEYNLRIIADHIVANTKGRIVIRAVVGTSAAVKIYGLIKIRSDAQGTDDYLEMRVLMLDKTAHAIAEPELEIEANNVKASHAASVGQVDAEQILYLMSRGLTRDQAKNEIISGFLMI